MSGLRRKVVERSASKHQNEQVDTLMLTKLIEMRINKMMVMLLAVALVGSFGLSSCKKDKEDEKKSSFQVAGTWKAMKFETTGKVPMSIDLTSPENAKKDFTTLFENPFIKAGLEVAKLSSEEVKGIIDASAEIFGNLGTVELELKEDKSAMLHKVVGVENEPTGTWSEQDDKVQLTLKDVKLNEKADTRVATMLKVLWVGREVSFTKTEDGKLTHTIKGKELTSKMMARYQNAPEGETPQEMGVRMKQLGMWMGLSKVIMDSDVTITLTR